MRRLLLFHRQVDDARPVLRVLGHEILRDSPPIYFLRLLLVLGDYFVVITLSMRLQPCLLPSFGPERVGIYFYFYHLQQVASKLSF